MKKYKIAVKWDSLQKLGVGLLEINSELQKLGAYEGCFII